MTGACAAAVKASIYTQPGAIMPFLDPLMRVLARHFPDAGLKTVSLPAKSGLNKVSRKLLRFRPPAMPCLELPACHAFGACCLEACAVLFILVR